MKFKKWRYGIKCSRLPSGVFHGTNPDLSPLVLYYVSGREFGRAQFDASQGPHAVSITWHASNGRDVLRVCVGFNDEIAMALGENGLLLAALSDRCFMRGYPDSI